jgi:hypothetical protein
MTATQTRGNRKGKSRGAKGGAEFIVQVQTVNGARTGMNGELLQGPN